MTTQTATQQGPGPAPASTVPTPYEVLQRLKEADPAFAAAAEARGQFRILPPRKPMADLVRARPDAEDELIRDRFLCRGGAVMLAAHTGKGKSSLVRQLAIGFAAGLPIFGLTPARRLRQLIIQAENDEGDEAAFRDGVACCPFPPPPAPASAPPDGPEAAPRPLPPEVFLQAARAVVVARCVDKAGDGFLETLAGLLDADGPFDLVWVDPLLAYLGGDVNDQRTVSQFLRTGLQPILIKHNIGLGLIHHTPKPIRQAARGSAVMDVGAYLGAGSAELANWPRAVLALESTNHHGVFRFRAPKRGGRLGWRDAAGEPTDFRYLAHATDGSIYWREPDQEELELATEDTAASGTSGSGSSAGGRGKARATAQDVVDILASAGGETPYTELREQLMAATGCGRSAATAAIQKSVFAGVVRKRGVCPAFYRTSGKAQPSKFNPYTGTKTGENGRV